MNNNVPSSELLTKSTLPARNGGYTPGRNSRPTVTAKASQGVGLKRLAVGADMRNKKNGTYLTDPKGGRRVTNGSVV